MATSISLTDMTTSNLAVVQPEPGASQPVLMTFPSGPPPKAVGEASVDGLRLDLRSNPAERKRHQCEALLMGDTMQYTGSNFGREGTGAQKGGTLLIGIHRKGSGTVRLLPASTLFVMKPQVKSPHVNLDPPTSSSSEVAGAEGAARKRRLVTELGSSKARKKQKAIAAGAVSAGAVLDRDALSTDIVGAASASAAAAASPGAQRSAADLHPLHPPFDLSATTVSTAYPRARMVPDHVWSALDHKALREASKSAEARASLSQKGALFPSFIIAKLGESMPASKSDRAELLRGLLYLCQMLRFNSLHASIKPNRPGSGSGSEPHPDAAKLELPFASWGQLLADFTEPETPMEGAPPPLPGAPTRRRITPPLREKLCMHVLAFALVLCHGELPCDALATSLALTEQKCAFYLKQLGCTVTRGRNGGAGVAKLGLPLTFPKLSRGGPPRG